LTHQLSSAAVTVTTVAGGSGIVIVKLSDSGADLAELYFTEDKNLFSGYLASADSKNNLVRASTGSDDDVIGIVSTKPGLIIGTEEAAATTTRSVLIALAGRVPTLVSSILGAIDAGDYIGVSAIPGFGAKIIGAGSVAGRALESVESLSPERFSNDLCPEEFRTLRDPSGNPVRCGMIMVFVNPFWFGGPTINDIARNVFGAATTSETDADGGTFSQFRRLVRFALETFGFYLESGIARLKEMFVESIFAKNANVENLIVEGRIQMKDRATGALYCTWIENGEWRKTEGECGEIPSLESASNASNGSQIPAGETSGVDVVGESIASDAPGKTSSVESTPGVEDPATNIIEESTMDASSTVEIIEVLDSPGTTSEVAATPDVEEGVPDAGLTIEVGPSSGSPTSESSDSTATEQNEETMESSEIVEPHAVEPVSSMEPAEEENTAMADVEVEG